MRDQRSTRLRHIIAASPDELEQAVERLPVKVEIKGSPLQVGKKWILYFTIPDNVERFLSTDLTKIGG